MNHNSNATIVSFGPTSDGALVFAAKSGDEQAFEILANHYQPKIFAVAMRYTRVREDAEDIVQQTFLKAFVHLHTFVGKASFRTWLTRIAINEALMFLLRGRVLRQVGVDDLSEDETATHGVEIPDSHPDPEVNCLKQEGAELLSAAMAKLAVRLRVAIELRELAGLSTRETARHMGLSVAAVKARIFRGRSELRKTLWHAAITARGAQPQ